MSIPKLEFTNTHGYRQRLEDDIERAQNYLDNDESYGLKRKRENRDAKIEQLLGRKMIINGEPVWVF